MNKPPELDLDGGWRIGESSFQEITRQITSVQPKVIVEFGAGASSIRLALGFPGVQIVAIEHDPAHFQEVVNLKQRFGPENIDVSFRPLRWQVHALAVYRSYSRQNFPDEVCAVMVDGPPFYAFCGREACLYQIYESLKTGGVLILDDYDRASEKKYVEHWLARLPGSFRRIETPEFPRLCILFKEEPRRLTVSSRVLFSNYNMLLHYAYDTELLLRLRKSWVVLKRIMFSKT